MVFTGLLRVRSEEHLRAIREQIANCSAFVATYERFRAVGVGVTGGNASRVIAVSDHELNATATAVARADSSRSSSVSSSSSSSPSSSSSSSSSSLQPETLQWWLLARALRRWGDELLQNYATIVRSRTDLGFPLGFSYGLCGGAGEDPLLSPQPLVFARSDLFFYARSALFLRLFGDDMWERATTLFSEFRSPEALRDGAAFRRFKDATDGFERRSCLRPRAYAPQPREGTLDDAQHCTT